MIVHVCFKVVFPCVSIDVHDTAHTKVFHFLLCIECSILSSNLSVSRFVRATSAP